MFFCALIIFSQSANLNIFGPIFDILRENNSFSILIFLRQFYQLHDKAKVHVKDFFSKFPLEIKCFFEKIYNTRRILREF